MSFLQFPSWLKPSSDGTWDKERMELNRNEIILSTLREWITNHMLSPSFNIPKSCMIDLEGINWPIPDVNLSSEILDKIVQELREAGWRAELSYGNSCLFVFLSESDSPPQYIKCTDY